MRLVRPSSGSARRSIRPRFSRRSTIPLTVECARLTSRLKSRSTIPGLRTTTRIAAVCGTVSPPFATSLSSGLRSARRIPLKSCAIRSASAAIDEGSCVAWFTDPLPRLQPLWSLVPLVLEHSRYQRLHPLPICRVCVGKGLRHQPLLLAHLHQEREDNDRN